MDQKKIDRINALAHKAKVEGLTAEERRERDVLRREYIDAVVGNLRQELEHILHQMLEDLTPRQQQILKLHYGFENGVCYSLEEIGRQLGISKERTRQIEHQAMDKLKAMGTSMGLEDFLE